LLNGHISKHCAAVFREDNAQTVNKEVLEQPSIETVESLQQQLEKEKEEQRRLLQEQLEKEKEEQRRLLLEQLEKEKEEQRRKLQEQKEVIDFRLNSTTACIRTIILVIYLLALQ